MKTFRLLVLVISVLTMVSGLVQMVRPDVVLAFVGGESTPATRHFFGIVGMFMLLFGGLITQALYEAQPSRVAFLWGGLQKIGASVAVGLGILHGLFSPLAGLVAGFDLVSGILFFIYLRSLKATDFSTFVHQ